MAVHPVVMALADIVLQPHCVRYQLNYSGIMHLLPGAKAQELHRDGDLYPFRHPCPPMLMPTMWALTDFTVGQRRDIGGAGQSPLGRRSRSDCRRDRLLR